MNQNVSANLIRLRSLERVKRMVLDAVADIDAKVYLFGSCARGKAGMASDIDIAIDPATPLPDGLLWRLKEALEESTVPYEVDVVDLSTTDARFREHVLAEAVVWRA